MVRLQWFSNWIQSQSVDVLCLQELVDWTPSLLTERMQEWGFAPTASSAFLTVDSGYHMAIVVNHRFSIRVLDRYQGGSGGVFHHGALHVEIQERHSNSDAAHPPPPRRHKMVFRLIVTHLSPHDGQKRIQEAEMLLHLANGDPNKSATPNVFVVGDLNALSPNDHVFYEQTKLVEHIRRLTTSANADVKQLGAHLSQKFLLRTVFMKNNIKYARIGLDYGALSVLLSTTHAKEHGVFQDLLSNKPTTAMNGPNNSSKRNSKKHGGIWHTVPTAIQEDYMHLQQMRLDAVLYRRTPSASNGDQAGGKGFHFFRQGSIVSPCSELLSDHLPVVVEMAWQSSPAEVSAGRDAAVALLPLTTACTEARICQWRDALNTHEENYYRKKKIMLEIQHFEQWRAENLRYGPPVVGQRGESCDQVCQSNNQICDVFGLQALNNCDRLSEAFPCWRGCR